jgi:PHD/YefM family antitoxin component YafN of YafNO toxin-antitoxin module
MYQTVSARQIQREYKKLLEEANKSKKPIVVISNNKLQGAIIGVDLLEKLQLEALRTEALEDSRNGRTTVISTEKELLEHFKDLEEYVSSKD